MGLGLMVFWCYLLAQFGQFGEKIFLQFKAREINNITKHRGLYSIF